MRNNSFAISGPWPCSPGEILWSSRRRRHSAPGCLHDLSFDGVSKSSRVAPPQPVCVLPPQISKGTSEDRKASFQNIEFSFSKCHVNLPHCWLGKKDNAPDIYLPLLPIPSSKSNLNEEKEDFQNQIGEGEKKLAKVACDYNQSFEFEDRFIKVEWDASGVTGSKKQYYEEKFIEDKPNAKVSDIIVLKPKWLDQDCKKVIFRDLHIDLKHCEMEKVLKKSSEEKPKNIPEIANLKSKDPPKSRKRKSSSDGKSINVTRSVTAGKRKKSVDDNSTILKEKTNKLSVIPYAVISSSSREHRCELCGKIFKKRSHLFHHILLHTGEKPHKCDTCGKRFRMKGRLNRHNLVHTGDKPFKCATCGRKFSRSDHLKLHVQRIHQKVKIKAYKCHECKESFSQKYQLTIHVGLFHKEMNPSRCRSCGRSFSQVITLQRHVKLGRCGTRKNVVSKG